MTPKLPTTPHKDTNHLKEPGSAPKQVIIGSPVTSWEPGAARQKKCLLARALCQHPHSCFPLLSQFLPVMCPKLPPLPVSSDSVKETSVPRHQVRSLRVIFDSSLFLPLLSQPPSFILWILFNLQSVRDAHRVVQDVHCATEDLLFTLWYKRMLPPRAVQWKRALSTPSYPTILSSDLHFYPKVESVWRGGGQ